MRTILLWAERFESARLLIQLGERFEVMERTRRVPDRTQFVVERVVVNPHSNVWFAMSGLLH